MTDGRGRRTRPHAPASPAGDLTATLTALAEWTGDRAAHEPWIAKMGDAEAAARAADADGLAIDADPVRPTRIYGELRARLDRDRRRIVGHVHRRVERVRGRLLAAVFNSRVLEDVGLDRLQRREHPRGLINRSPDLEQSLDVRRRLRRRKAQT